MQPEPLPASAQAPDAAASIPLSPADLNSETPSNPPSNSNSETPSNLPLKKCKAGMKCTFLRAELKDHPFTDGHLSSHIHEPIPEPVTVPAASIPRHMTPPPPLVNDSDVSALVAMGFPHAVALAGLHNCGGDVEMAADYLLSNNQIVPMDIDEKSADMSYGPHQRQPPSVASAGRGVAAATSTAHEANSNQLPGTSELHLRRNLSMRASSRAEALRMMVAECFGGEDSDPDFASASFVLPDLDQFTDDFAAFVRRDLIYSHAQTEMEHLKIINWSEAPKLFPLNTNGKGNCLVDACSLSLWGIQDSSMNLLLLRRELHRLLLNYKALFASRYKGKDLDRLIEEANPEQTQGKGATLEKLEQLHILGLAHLLGRPIIVYAEAKYRDFQDRIVGDCEGESRMDGIYLPLEPSALFFQDRAQQTVRPAPVCLAFRKFHFSAAVPSASWEALSLDWSKLPKASLHRKKENIKKEEEKKVVVAEAMEESKTGKEEKTPTLWYPLVDSENKELFVHFLKDGENKQALLERWFSLVNVNGILGARMPSENLSFNSELLHEYLESTAENVSALPPEALSDALGKNKPCANRCGRKGILTGLCDDCEFLPEIVKLTGCPVGQGCTRGVYKTTSYDAKGRPIYKKAHGHPFYLFNYYQHHTKSHVWVVCNDLHNPGNPNMQVTSSVFNVTRTPALWTAFRGGPDPWIPAPEFKIAPYEAPKPKHDFCPDVACSNLLPCIIHTVAPVLTRCKNSDTKPNHDFMGNSATGGLCSQCHGESFYGEMIVSGSIDTQVEVNGVYRFHGVRTDDEGEQRPAFSCVQKNQQQYFLYFLEGEWSIGDVLYHASRRVLVSAALELPHEVKNTWVYWNGMWTENPNLKVTQRKRG